MDIKPVALDYSQCSENLKIYIFTALRLNRIFLFLILFFLLLWSH